MIRITIEGPQGSGKTRLGEAISGLLHARGWRSINIIDADVSGSPQTPCADADAVIILRQTRQDPISEALNSGDGSYRP